MRKIRRTSFILALLLLLAISPVHIYADTIPYQVTADYINIRNGVGTKGTKVLGRINHGCTFQVTELKKNSSDGSTWGKTKYNNITGWVNVGYAKKVTQSSTKAKKESASTYIVNTKTLNVRKDAGTSYTILGKVQKGNKVTVSTTKKAADGSTWAKITYQKLSGWVNISYLKKAAVTEQTKTSKNGWNYVNKEWKYYKNGIVQFASNRMYNAYSKIKGKSSGSDYYLVVDRQYFRVYAFKKEKGSWVPKKIMKCSVGKKGHETPAGTFSIFSRWDILKSGGVWEYYPVEFLSNESGAWCFHSVLYYKGTELKDVSKAKLYNGTLEAANSLGCVRLSLENAKWIYDNCTNGTKVLIY